MQEQDEMANQRQRRRGKQLTKNYTVQQSFPNEDQEERSKGASK